MKKRAVVFASLFFESKIKVGSHHYAEALAKDGYDVLYVSYPISFLHYLVWFKSDNKVRLFKRSLFIESGVKLAFVPFSLLPLINIYPLNTRFFLTKWLYLSDFLFNREVKNYINECNLIWVESAFFLEAVRIIKKRNPNLLIFTRLADNVFAFRNFPTNYRYLLENLFFESNQIVISARSLKKIIKPEFQSKVVWLPNAINFDKLKNYSTEIPIEYASITKYKVVYVGAIEDWFDWSIITFLLQNLPDIYIYIIGPLSRKMNYYYSHSNLFILGPRNHSDLGRYLANADIGIIPFKQNDLIDYVDPIKFYEYTYFGLPTVCTYWEEVSELNDIYLAKNKQEFLLHITEIINNPNLNKKIMSLDLLEDRDWYKNLKKII